MPDTWRDFTDKFHWERSCSSHWRWSINIIVCNKFRGLESLFLVKEGCGTNDLKTLFSVEMNHWHLWAWSNRFVQDPWVKAWAVCSRSRWSHRGLRTWIWWVWVKFLQVYSSIEFQKSSRESRFFRPLHLFPILPFLKKTPLFIKGEERITITKFACYWLAIINSTSPSNQQ